VLVHEVLEKAAAALPIVRDVLFQRRYWHSAYVADCEHSGELDAQGEPFYVAVKLAREKKGGLQCRVHEIMLFDRNKNGLESHGDLPFARTPPPCVHKWARLTYRRLAHDPWGSQRHPGGSLSSCKQPGKLDVSSPIT
jgi:hypothetical protein